MTAGPFAYISTIAGVREVALTGTADLDYWRIRLEGEGLSPFEENGRASLLLTAIASKFRGIPFRELSISVRVGDGGEAFLVQAFNSSRLLAYAEQALFQTPYRLAQLTVDETIPARVEMAGGGRVLFSARMAGKTAPHREASPLYEGPIYLPGGRSVFYARLSGAARIYSFDAPDTILIEPRANEDGLARLVESNFRGKEWLVRAGAIHARSKTYQKNRRLGRTG